MIGSWDETDAVLALAFNAWSKGNGTSNKNTGNMPSFPDGDFQNCAITNCGIGYGYLYNSADGYFHGDGVDDHIQTNYFVSVTNASNLTIECKLDYVAVAGIGQFICGNAAGGAGTNRFWFYITATNTIDVRFDWGASFDRVLTSTTLTTGNSYTLCFRKTAGTVQIFINGNEASYATQDTYALGSNVYTEAMRFGDRSGVYEMTSNVYWFAVYEAALSQARITENHGLDNAMGLIGTNTSDVMALVAVGGYPVNHEYGQMVGQKFMQSA